MWRCAGVSFCGANEMAPFCFCAKTNCVNAGGNGVEGKEAVFCFWGWRGWERFCLELEGRGGGGGSIVEL